MSDIKLACDMAEQIKNDLRQAWKQNRANLSIFLHEAQHLQGYLPEETQTDYRFQTWNSRIEKCMVSSLFYTFFTMTPKGKHPISVCMGTACYVLVQKNCWKSSNVY